MFSRHLRERNELGYDETMTTPDERTRALRQTREFLVQLSVRGEPAPIRREAERLLRHYPLDGMIDVLALLAPAWMSSVDDSLSQLEALHAKGVRSAPARVPD